MTENAERRLSEAAERLVTEFPPGQVPAAEFLGARFDAGLAWVHFPPGLGGLGVAPGLQGIADAIVEAAGGPDPFKLNPIGYGMAAPTVLAHGSTDLQQRLLRPLYVCDEIWCQLFSETGAGSDLAGLATRAVRDGDGWRVNGQKVWTSKAHEARWALLLARTDPDVPKHEGLSYFILDMRDAGVEVRPLRQLTGDSEFNEVWLRGRARERRVAARRRGCRMAGCYDHADERAQRHRRRLDRAWHGVHRRRPEAVARASRSS